MAMYVNPFRWAASTIRSTSLNWSLGETDRGTSLSSSPTCTMP
jgi:hypothetical protein